MRKIEDIVEDAKNGFMIIKEKRLQMQKYAEIGNPKPIFTKLIEDIKLEFQSEQKLKNRFVERKLLPISMESIPAVNLENSTMSARLPPADKTEQRRERPKSAPNRRLAMIQKHPSPGERNQNPNDQPKRGFEHSYGGSSSNSSFRSKMMGDLAAGKSLSDDEDQFDANQNMLTDFARGYKIACSQLFMFLKWVLLSTGRADRTARRPHNTMRRSSNFMDIVLESDEKIIMALQRRNAIAMEEQTQLVKRIEDKEREKALKEETMLRQERQLLWLVVIKIASRFRWKKQTLFTYNYAQ